jgi:hypothetical protein
MVNTKRPGLRSRLFIDDLCYKGHIGRLVLLWVEDDLAPLEASTSNIALMRILKLNTRPRHDPVVF